MIGTFGAGWSFNSPPQARKARQSKAAALTADAEAAERNRAAEDALKAIKEARDNARRLREEAATAKVERLKRELQCLKMYGGGDPKAIARQAARIARELSAAAGELGGVPGLGAASAGPAHQTQAEAAAPAAETQASTPRPTGRGDHGGGHPSGERLGGGKISDEDVRTLFRQAEALFERQRRRAAEQGAEDDEYDALAYLFRRPGVGEVAGAAMAAPVPVDVVI